MRLRFFLFHVPEKIHRNYHFWFIFCEFLNVINVVGQWALINWILNGGFTLYGHKYFE